MLKINVKGVIVSNDDKWIYDWFDMEATSPKDIKNQLDTANGQDLDVEINSYGGDVYAGSEIYTALKSYPGRVNVKIVGVAASAASVIAMAGDKVIMSPTAQFMIHNVSSGAFGDYRALQHEADVLKGHNVSIANAYILKTDLKQSELISLMNEETYMNAQEAKKYGFIDEIMFDEGNKLVAGVKSSMIPQEIIEKMRNYLKENAEEPKLTDSKSVEIHKAKLNLLKLKEVRL